jgi:hypothetical protein
MVRHGRFRCLIVAVALAIVAAACATELADSDSIPSAATNESPATIETDSPMSLSARGELVAYVNNGEVRLEAPGVRPIELGTGQDPVAFTKDRRYVAWNVGSTALGLLDLSSGVTATVDLPDGLSLNWLGGLGDGFIVSLGATDFEIERMRLAWFDRFAWIEPEQHLTSEGAGNPLEVRTIDRVNENAGVAWHWQTLDTQSAYAVVSQGPGTWYEHNPQLVAITPDGAITLLVADCEGLTSDCDNQLGMRHVAISPGGGLVAYQGGNRNGCWIYPELVLTPLDTYSPIALTGVPERFNFLISSINWTSATEFTVVGGDLTTDEDSHCAGPDWIAPPATTYYCTTTGTCRPSHTLKSRPHDRP